VSKISNILVKTEKSSSHQREEMASQVK